MIHVIIMHGYDWMESMGNEKYEEIVGYADTKEEAESYINKKLASIDNFYNSFGTNYPYYSVKQLEKLSVAGE